MKKFLLLTILSTTVFFAKSQTGNKLLPIKSNYKWGYIDKEGKIIIEPTYDFAEGFICDFAEIKNNGYYGVVNSTGKLIVPANNTGIEIFCPNFIAFKKDSLWGLDNAEGGKLLENKYDKIENCDIPGFLILNKRNQYGIFNAAQKKTIEPVFHSITVAGSAFFKVLKEQKYGLINSDLNYVMQPDYISIDVISDNVILHKQKDFFGINLASGQIALKPEFMAYKKLSKDFLALKSKKGTWVLFSVENQKVISTEEQESFTLLDKDLVMLNKQHKHGVIDKNGTIVLPQAYSNIHLSEGFLLVEQNSKWGIADAKGKFIIETVHNKMFPIRKSLAVFETATGKGIINTKGKILAQPIYTDINMGESSAKCFKPDGSVFVLKFESIPPSQVKTLAGKPTEVSKAITHNHAWLKGPSKKWGLHGHDTLFVSYRYDEIQEPNPDYSLGLQKIDYRTNQKLYGYIHQQKLVEMTTNKVSLIDKAAGKILLQSNAWDIRTEDFNSGEYARVVLEGGQQALVGKSGKLISEYSTITKDKRVVKQPINYIGNFNNGVARFCTGCTINYAGDWQSDKVTGGKWGFINNEGAIVMEPQFDEGSDMFHNRAIVKLRNFYGLVSSTGNFVLKTEYTNLSFIPESEYHFLQVESKKERYGLINSQGKTLTDIIYEKIFPFKEGLAKVMVGGRYGFIDESDKLVIPAIYTDVLDFSEGLAAVALSKNWGYIDKSGNQVVLPFASVAGNFNNGLAPVGKDGKISYINKEGKTVITTQFADGSDFGNGLAIAVLPGGGYLGIIDLTGQFVLEAKYNEIESCVLPNFLRVKYESEWRVFDKKTLKIISKKPAQSISEFYEGIATANIGGYFNFIDTTGKIINTKKYTSAGVFSNGLARVQLEGKYGYINSLGENVINHIFTNCTDFSNGKAFAEGGNRLYAIIDKNGKRITYDIFANPKPFTDGFALVQSPSSKEYFFTNQEGKNTFNLKFETGYPFADGIARVKQKKWGLLNTKGNLIADFKYDYMDEFTNGQSVVGYYSSVGIVDLDGKTVAEPLYDSFTFVDKDLLRVEKSDAIGYYNLGGSWIWQPKK